MTDKIYPHRLHDLRNAGIKQFCVLLQNAVTDDDITASASQHKWNNVLSAYSLFDQVFMHNKGFESTPAIAAKVDLVTDCCVEIRTVAKGFQHDEAGDLKTAADHVIFLLKPYVELSSLDYYHRVGMATELQQVLSLPANASSLALLNLTGTVTRLGTLLTEFDQIYGSRQTERQGWKDLISVKEARKRLLARFKEWEETIQSAHDFYATTDTPNTTKLSQLEAIISKVNACIDQVNINEGKGGSGNGNSGNNGSDNNGGDSGDNTDDGHQEAPEPNPGGDNNNGGSDKPPNPESPD
jgi:hypothetical protein